MAKAGAVRPALRRDDGDLGRWTHSIEAVVLAKVALLVLVFVPTAADTFTLPKSAVSGALSLVLGALLLGLVRVGGLRVLRWSLIHSVAVVLISVFLLASLFGLDGALSLYGAPRRYLGLLQLTDSVLLLVSSAACFRRPSSIARLTSVVLATSLVVVAYGTLQRLGHDPVVYKEAFVGRAFSTLGQPDLLAGYLSVVATTAVGALIFHWKAMSWPTRAGLTALVVVEVELLFSTLARLGLLGLAGGMTAIAVLLWVTYPQRRRTAVVGVLAAGVALIAITSLSSLGQRLSPSALLGESRLEIWRTAARIVANRPLFGLGPDNFIAAYPPARSVPSSVNDALQSSTHDWLLYYMTSSGLIGATVAVLLVVLVFIAAVRMARRRDPAALALVPLAAFLGQGLANVNDVGLDWFMWVSAGVVASASGRRDPVRVAAGRSRATPASTGRQLGLAALVLLVAGLAVVLVQPRVGASQALFASERLVDTGHPLEAVQEARQAISLDPRRADYWSGFGTALSAAGSPSGALNAYQAAADLEPWWPLHWRNIALMRLALGDEKAASSALARATTNDPYDATARNLLAKLAYKDGQFARAIDEGEKAVSLLPLQPDAYDAPVQAQIQLGELDRAEQLVKAGLTRVNDLHLHVLLAKIYLAGDRLTESKAEVEYVLQLDPANAEAVALSQRFRPSVP